jgi:hypothetical protein
MNQPTDYERIAVIVPKPLKTAMINYSSKTGRNITWVINTLIAKLLRGEIDLDDATVFSDRVKAAAKRRQS